MKNIILTAVILGMLLAFVQYADGNAQSGCFWLLIGILLCEIQILMFDKYDRIK